MVTPSAGPTFAASESGGIYCAGCDQWFGKRGMGLFMGGYFSSKAEHRHGCLYATATHAPDYHDYSTGFRCCADAK